MRTLPPPSRPRVLVSRIAPICLLAFSVGVLAHSHQGQAAQQPAAPQPAAAEAAPAATPPAAPAAPVKFSELACDEKHKGDRNILKVLKNPAPSAANLATIQTYLEEYGFPRWTVKVHEHEVRTFRRELRDAFRRIASQPMYNKVNDLAFSMLGDIAKGNYSPVARINAMLALSDLNVAEPARSTQDPVPLARALPLLLQIYGDPNQMDGVRIAAAIGILRHVDLKIADAQVRNAQILPVMLAVAQTNEVPDGRSADGHAWFRILALKTLASLAVAGQQGEVANTLKDVAGDPDCPLWVRCATARCLGRLDYTDPAGMKSAEFIAKLTELATAICSQEVATLEKLRKDELIAGQKIQGLSAGGRGMYGSMEMGMEMEETDEMDETYEMEMGMGMMDDMYSGGRTTPAEEDTPETRRITGSRRRLIDQLSAVLTGLGTDVRGAAGGRDGIYVLVTTPENETLHGKLTLAITTLLKALDDEDELDSGTLDDVIATAADEIGLVLVSAAGGDLAEPPATDPAAPAVPDEP